MRKYLELEEVRYCITIGIIALIAFSIFIVLAKFFGVWSPVASVVGCLFAEVLGFHYKRNWVFRNTNKKRERIRFFLYILYSFIYLAMNAILMHYFVDIEHFEEVRTQVFIAFILFMPNLDMNELIFTV